ALLADLVAHGGRVATGVEVRERADLPRARAYLFDTEPTLVLRVLGHRVPAAVARRLRGYRFGAAAAKVDLVLRGPIPWADPRVGAAGTVHLGGTRPQVVAA